MDEHDFVVESCGSPPPPPKILKITLQVANSLIDISHQLETFFFPYYLFIYKLA